MSEELLRTDKTKFCMCCPTPYQLCMYSQNTKYENGVTTRFVIKTCVECHIKYSYKTFQGEEEMVSYSKEVCRKGVFYKGEWDLTYNLVTISKYKNWIQWDYINVFSGSQITPDNLKDKLSTILTFL